MHLSIWCLATVVLLLFLAVQYGDGKLQLLIFGLLSAFISFQINFLSSSGKSGVIQEKDLPDGEEEKESQKVRICFRCHRIY